MVTDLRLYRRLLTLLVGILLVFLGLTQIMIDLQANVALSEEAIIERAKALGMVEMKDVYKDDLKDGKLDNQITTPPPDPK